MNENASGQTKDHVAQPHVLCGCVLVHMCIQAILSVCKLCLFVHLHVFEHRLPHTTLTLPRCVCDCVSVSCIFASSCISALTLTMYQSRKAVALIYGKILDVQTRCCESFAAAGHVTDRVLLDNGRQHPFQSRASRPFPLLNNPLSPGREFPLERDFTLRPS